MANAAVFANALSEAEKASLVSVIIAKMEQACFIDWVVGLVLLAFYGVKLYTGHPFVSADLWPAIGALAITRVGNTIVRAVCDWSYWRYHKAGEGYDAGQTH